MDNRPDVIVRCTISGYYWSRRARLTRVPVIGESLLIMPPGRDKPVIVTVVSVTHLIDIGTSPECGSNLADAEIGVKPVA